LRGALRAPLLADAATGADGATGAVGASGADAVCYFALVDVNGGLSNTCVYGIATSSTVSNSTGTYIVGSIGAPDLSVCVAIAQVVDGPASRPRCRTRTAT
jgi:hypothetical protein